MKWDGEWHITIEVFRDLGLAFAVVLVLIYVLVVGWFQSFRTPLLIMAAIPFSLVGILPAHAAMGAFFTATSMIGFIAGAGIVVRNSIILVDFIELRLREGLPLEQAVVDAGAVRFRPMALTATAVIVGAGVILFDPIFQGLAISLMAGELASLLLSRMAVPVLYYMASAPNSGTGRVGDGRGDLTETRKSIMTMTAERALSDCGRLRGRDVLWALRQPLFLWFTLFVVSTCSNRVHGGMMMAILRKAGLRG
jgi:predicted RND superfamily exporter protein